MSRKTARPKTKLSEAVTELRSSLGQNQFEFAETLGVSRISLARYESSRDPGGEILERLLKLAVKHRLKQCAGVFRLAIEDEKESRFLRRRMADILDPLNIKEAGERLQKLVRSIRRTKQTILDNLDIDQGVLVDIEAVEREVLRMADLIFIDGRREIEE